MFSYPGAFHIHSKYSDGTATISEIANYAKKAGLKWIIITDHNSLEGLHNNEEGWYDGVAVLIGQEISPIDSNHFIALGLNEVVAENNTPQEFINITNKLGGFGFIAHPAESETRKNPFPPLRWTDYSVQGSFGIEIWNHLSDWTDNYNKKIGLYSLLFREKILKGPNQNILNWWDSLNNKDENVIPAIGGLDVHALKIGPIKVFPYSSSFKTLINKLYLKKELSSDFKTAKNQILEAVKNGQLLLINCSRHKKSINSNFYAFTENEKAFSGTQLKYRNNYSIFIELPVKAIIKLYYNGNLIEECFSSKLLYRSDKEGKYRFEAYYKNKPWIFSNPLTVSCNKCHS